ncbi:acetate kinase [Lacihabitans sp. LS3-19]|uniref:acetate/propionate family kinase n=1 Tax=Lacihabitans sp. LS3-19 TaxID=2487335 RepID=UPI0020CC025F|nr:acetate kinase [Lacihabitans sp. LS3-19]MCP9767517.1 acetate kinase [Lacihabitans sp. LS3-19]
MYKILVINAGSSSLKFQLIEMPEQIVLAQGMADRIGQDSSKFVFETQNSRLSESEVIPDHEHAMELLAEYLLEPIKGVIDSPFQIAAVGHRVVHGGCHFKNTTLINDEVKLQIKELFSLAPLHNPANLTGIEVSEKIFPNAIQIAVFDTAFHQTIPEKAYKYAIPKELSDKHQIRLYGFHGTSHKYVSQKATEYLKNPEAKIVVLHLGNGCSATAVNAGKSIDHSLGFGPVTGLIMGTRSGDIDPAVILFLIEKLGYSAKEVNEILNKKSGLLGLTGFSDLREIQIGAENGNLDCILAIEMSAYRIKKQIGAYAAAMNGLDAIVFTAGIGENSSILRAKVCEDLDFLGIELDKNKNILPEKGIREIQKGKTKILIIPTNEELEIAIQSFNLLENQKTQ